jgi:hypothetical protein
MGSLNLMVKATRLVLSIGDVFYCPHVGFTTNLRNGQIQIDILGASLIEYYPQLIKKEALCLERFLFHGRCLKLGRKSLRKQRWKPFLFMDPRVNFQLFMN